MFQYHGPDTFLYILLTYALCITCIFCVMQLVGSQQGERFPDDDAVNRKGDYTEPVAEEEELTDLQQN